MKFTSGFKVHYGAVAPFRSGLSSADMCRDVFGAPRWRPHFLCGNLPACSSATVPFSMRFAVASAMP